MKGRCFMVLHLTVPDRVYHQNLLILNTRRLWKGNSSPLQQNKNTWFVEASSRKSSPPLYYHCIWETFAT